MKTIFIIGITFFILQSAVAQTDNPVRSTLEEGLEQITEKEDAVPENDQYWQDMDERHRHRLNLNHASTEDLESLVFLNSLQVSAFLAYRTLLGSLLNIYELQSIPGWDLATIYRILPFVTVENLPDPTESMPYRWKRGRHSFLLRVSQVPEKSKGYEQAPDSGSSHYLGSPQHIFFRYNYNYRNLLQYGMAGDKDAGEQFFRGAQRFGFDFYTFHFFLRQKGIIKSFALGDFTVNLGQGMIQWQGLAFTKSSDALAIKRQAASLRPYNSPGEYNYHRGAAVVIGKGNWETLIFLSYKHISTNLDPDTVSREDVASSIESSGYHRTIHEISDRNNATQFAAGGNVSYTRDRFHFGINAVTYQFSRDLQKQDLPYNLYSIHGKRWSDYSINYHYTFQNLHVFGEAAIGKNRGKGFIQGAIISLGRFVDMSMLCRFIDPSFQSLYSNAFTENTSPTNEYGIYAGLSVHPTPAWQVDAYYDGYRFPWLRYRADAPGYGRDFFLQLIYRPTKNWQLNTRFRNEAKTSNDSLSASVHPQSMFPRQSWRTEFTTVIAPGWKWRNRFELLWYDQKRSDAGQGFLGLMDLSYQPRASAFDANIRLQYFETSGYTCRLYAFGEDVLYSYSIPAFYNNGFSYYVNLHFRVNRLIHRNKSTKTALDAWFRWERTSYRNTSSIGTGLDEIHGR